MRKWALFAFLMSTADHVAILSLWSQDEIDLLDASGFDGRQRVACVFPHDDHNDAAQIDECNECHHVYEDGVRSEDESSEDQSAPIATVKSRLAPCRGCERPSI